MIQVEDRHAALLAVALRRLDSDLRRDGYSLPPDLAKLAADLLDPGRDMSRRVREAEKVRKARWRARKRAAA